MALPLRAPPTKPPMYPASPKPLTCSMLGKENIRDASVRRFVPEEMRDVPALGHRVARKVGNVNGNTVGFVLPSNSNGTSSLLEELESMLIYVECVTASLLRRTGVPVAPEGVRAIPCNLQSPRRDVPHDGLAHRSLAMDLHDSSNNILDCFLEIDNHLSFLQVEKLGEIEKRINAAASDVNIALDAIVQHYRRHAVEDVREFFIGNEQTIEECRRQVLELLQAALQIIALRLIVKEEDLARAKMVFAEYKKDFFHEDPRRPPGLFLTWMEKKWFPAMEAWKCIVSLAHERVETMDVSSVIAWGKKEALAQSSLFSEILRPGESLSDLIRDQLEKPLTVLSGLLKKKHDCLEALRAAIVTPNVKDLMEHVCTLEEVAAVCELKSAADRKLLKEGRRLIISLQQVENLDAALRLATQVGETMTLFRTIHHANEILLSLGIAGDVSANREAVAYCSALLTEMSNLKGVSPTEFIARRVDIGRITIPHVPSQVWTTETTALYQAACQCLTVRTAQDLVRFDLERVLKSRDGPLLSVTGSASGDDTSTASSANHSFMFARSQTHISFLKSGRVQELRATLKRAGEVGLNCQLVQEGESYLRSIEVLKLKIHFEAQLRVLFVHNPENITFGEIYKKVYDFCMEQASVLPRPPENKLRLRYQDRDGDCISLLTQEDWNVFVAEEAPNGVCGSKLELFCDFLLVPQKHVTNELLEVSPTPRDKKFLDSCLTEVAPKSSGSTVFNEAPPEVFSPPILQGNDAAAAKYASGDSGDDSDAATNSIKLTHPCGVNPKLHSSSSSSQPQHVLKPNRMELDDSPFQKRRLAREPGSGQPQPGSTKAELLRRQFVQKKTAQHSVLEKPPRNNTPVRCKVYSVRLDTSFTPHVSKKQLTARCDTRKQPQASVKRISDKPVSSPEEPSKDADIPLSTASAPSCTVISGATNSSLPPQPQPKSQSQPEKTPQPFFRGSEPLEIAPVKRWNEDDVQLELQTVASVASTVSRPVINIRGTKLTDKGPLANRQNEKCAVSLRSNASKTTTKVAAAEVASIAGEKQSANAVKVPEKKHEWDADMFMQCGASTTTGEAGTAQVACRGDNKDQQPRQQDVKSSIRSLGGSFAAIEAVVATAISDTSGNVKEKTDLLQKLKQLHKENQKAIKTAIVQRRSGN